jgi:hypothetical protein
MMTIGDNNVVVNGMTKSGWINLVREAMERRHPILLLVALLDESQKNELEQLVARHHYSPPQTLTEDQWNQYKVKLNLSDYAAKEQGINRNEVFLIQPDRS